MAKKLSYSQIKKIKRDLNGNSAIPGPDPIPRKYSSEDLFISEGKKKERRDETARHQGRVDLICGLLGQKPPRVEMMWNWDEPEMRNLWYPFEPCFYFGEIIHERDKYKNKRRYIQTNR